MGALALALVAAGAIGAWGVSRQARVRLEGGLAAHRQADTRFRAVVESAPSGMVMINRAGTITLVNHEIERLFGYAREELLGQPIERLVPERFRHRHPAFRADFFVSPQTRAMGAGRELYGLRKDGGEIPVEIGLNPIESDEGVFVRVSDSDSAMLRYLGDRGVTPGSSFEVLERQPFGGPLFVRFGGDVHPLGGELARAMRVQVEA